MGIGNISSRHAKAIYIAKGIILDSPIGRYCEKIILYGSCARKEETYFSDVDLFIVLDKNAKEMSRDIRNIKAELMYINDNLPEVQAVFCFGNDWETDSKTFYEEIREDGKVIWTRNHT